MRRGDVVWVDLNPVRGREADKIRPAVLVSNDGANRSADERGRGVVTIVPITTNVKRIYPFQVLLPRNSCGLAKDSKAQAEQVRGIDVQRVTEVAGRLSPTLMSALDDALRLHLGL
jgi:mRNA interferase MazF